MVKNDDLRCYRLLKSELLERYKEKFTFDFLLGRIDGSDKFGNVFTITISNTDTVLTVSPTTSPEIIKELSSIIYMIMCARPICQYELRYFDIPMRTIEWDIAAPENRIMNLVQGKNTFVDNPPIYNLQLFGGRKKDEYQKINENDLDKIEGANEFIVFYELTSLLKKLANSSKFIVEHYDYFSYLVECTKKYGVEIKTGDSLRENKSFRAWLSFWGDFQKTLSRESLDELIKAIDEGKNVSKILPKNSWKDYLDQGLKE